MTWISLFLMNTAFIGLRAYQQLNVVHKNWLAVTPTAFLIALCEVVVIVEISVQKDYWLFLPIGAGGALGCYVAMVLHKQRRSE